jgi:sec-independent protein translocase protein TatA
MWRPGYAEIIIVLVIVILLFGPGRISKVSKEIGASITAFREGLKSKEESNPPAEQDSDKKPDA